jgi:hypothetical protein
MCLFAYTQTSKEHWIECNNEGCLINDPYYTDNTTVNWTGKCSNGKANGYGILTKYDNGKLESTFTGYYKNGIRQGKGQFNHVFGTVHKGYFVDDQMVGKGTWSDSLGNRYKGSFINYRMHGNGKMVFNNGITFNGFMVTDKMYSGTLTEPDGSVSNLHEYLVVDKIYKSKSSYKPKIGKQVTEYFDVNWKHCDKLDAAYYRTVTYKAPHKPIGTIKNYNISGVLLDEYNAAYISYDDQAKNFYEGEFWKYYPNHSIKEHGYFLNNKINGILTLYYESGTISDKCSFKDGLLHGVSKRWDDNGKLFMTANFNNNEVLNERYDIFHNDTICKWLKAEDFNINRNEWEIWNPEDESVITNDNKLKFSVSDSIFSPHFREKYIDINTDKPFEIEMNISNISGVDSAACGISFFSNTYDTFYNFCINKRQEYFIIALNKGEIMPLTDITYCQAIKQGNEKNTLTITRTDDAYFFCINGHLVETFQLLPINEYNIGVAAYYKGEHLIHNIYTYELNPACLK